MRALLVLAGLLLAPALCHAGTDPPCPLDMEALFPAATYSGPAASSDAMKGKVVVITGASTGLGRGIADRMAAAGARVVGTSRNPGAYTAKCTYTKPGDACAPEGWQLWQLDTTSQSSVDAFIGRVKAAYGRIDLLVLNACRGYGQNTFKGGCNDISRQQEVVDVCYWGTVRMLMAARPLLPTSGYARVVIIASTASFVSIQGGLPYAAAKAAVARIDEEWLYEYYGPAASNVKLITVFPGSMFTNFARNTIPACANQADANGKLAPREWQQWEAWQFKPGQPYITAQQGGEAIFRLAALPSPKWRYLLNHERSIGFIRKRICTHLASPMELWPKAYE